MQGAQGGGLGSTVVMLVVMVAIFYFMIIRPENKRKKQTKAMLDAMKVGDSVTTIGGIIGRVVTVKEDSIIIETGADKNRLKFARWSISQKNKANEKLASPEFSNNGIFPEN